MLDIHVKSRLILLLFGDLSVRLNMKKQYECLLIVNGTLSEEKKQEAEKKIIQIFTKFKAKILGKVDWGRRNLAYPMKKVLQGYYYFYYIEIETDAIAEMRILFGYEASILKNIFFSTSDWQKETSLLKQIAKEPNRNVDKLIKVVNEE